jgi:multidrug efflux system membrane fusion protein
VSKKNKIIIAGICVLAAALGYAYFSGDFSSSQKAVVAKSTPIKVTASKVIEEDLPLPVQAIGTVQAYSTVSIQSMVAGQLIKVGFKEGDYVKKGQLLFLIDPRPFEADLDQAKANLAHDQANLENAQLQVKRNAPLVKKGYIAGQDFDQLVANQKAAQATVDADKAAINTAKLQLAYTSIQSPIDGHTGSLQVYPGNIIQVANGTALVTITQIEPIYVSFSIPQQYLGAIQTQNAKSAITVAADVEGKTVQGKLSFIDNTVDSSTGTIQLKATFANMDHSLWPGEFVNVTLPTTVLPHALIVPNNAIQAGQNGSYVYVINADSTVSYQNIQTGPMVGNDTVVLQGLQAGQQVVLDGQLRLRNGSSVSVVPTPAPASGS